MEFSDNGYQLAAASTDHSRVQIWDMRKKKEGKQRVYKELEFDKNINSLSYDKTGRCLLVSCQDLHLLSGKKYKLVASFKGNDVEHTVLK